jgi:hypothetical protein
VDRVYTHYVQVIMAFFVEMPEIQNNVTDLSYERGLDSYLCDASGWNVNVVIFFVEVSKIQNNVTDLSNERGLDIYLSDVSGWNVSVVILNYDKT